MELRREIRDRLFGRRCRQRADLNITFRQTTGADEEGAREDKISQLGILAWESLKESERRDATAATARG